MRSTVLVTARVADRRTHARHATARPRRHRTLSRPGRRAAARDGGDPAGGRAGLARHRDRQHRAAGDRGRSAMRRRRRRSGSSMPTSSRSSRRCCPSPPSATGSSPRRIYFFGWSSSSPPRSAARWPAPACTTLARAPQGIGAGALMSVNIALVRMVYPPERLGRGVGLNALIVGIGFAAGPTSPRWCWRSHPGRGSSRSTCRSACSALAFALPHLPRSTPHDHRFDPLTALLTAATFAALVLALGSAAQREPAVQVLVPPRAGARPRRLLLHRQAGHPAPMLPVDLLRRPLSRSRR